MTKKIQQNNKDIIHTGFVPEDEVAKIFSIADLVVFPYRARMSSSGALALTLQYHKSFICSKKFSENLQTDNLKQIAKDLDLSLDNLVFNLNSRSFTNCLINHLEQRAFNKKTVSFAKKVAQERNWQRVAEKYLSLLVTEKPVLYRKVLALKTSV